MNRGNRQSSAWLSSNDPGNEGAVGCSVVALPEPKRCPAFELTAITERATSRAVDQLDRILTGDLNDDWFRQSPLAGER